MSGCREFGDPAGFLEVVRPALEAQEALYGLMLGLMLRLVENRCHYGGEPFMAVVGEREQPDLIALMTPPYKLQLVAGSGDPASAVDALAEQLREGEWPVPAVLATEDLAGEFAKAWTWRMGCTARPGMRQRI